MEGFEELVDKELLELIFTSCLPLRYLSILPLVCRRWKDTCASPALRRAMYSGCAFSFGGDRHHQEPLGHPRSASGAATTEAYLGTPTRIRAFDDTRIVGVAAGWQHSLFLADDGKVYSCGVGAEGRLGLGSEESFDVPRRVIGLDDVFVAKVVAGAFHSFLLTNQGTVYAFGYGRHGRLGLGNTDHAHSPTLISGLCGQEIVQVSGGNMHSLALTKEGRVYSWGDGSSCALGLVDPPPNVTLPVLVEALKDLRIISISAGDWHSLFLTADGKVYSCGKDRGDGRLGYKVDDSGTKTDQLLPRLIPAFKNDFVTVIAAGEAHSLVATDDGRLFSFGRNTSGELGLGWIPELSGEVNLPSLVTSFAPAKVVHLVAGAKHSFVLTDDGALYSFGNGDNYRLGHGMVRDCVSTPKRVEKLAPYFICGVASNGRHALACT